MSLFRSCRSPQRSVLEFRSCRPENLLLVENILGEGAVIRAAEDNFTPAQQRALVRYLKHEGFILDQEGHLSARNHLFKSRLGGSSVRWIVDPAWPHIDKGFNFYMRRLFCRIFIGVAMLLLLLAGLFVFEPGTGPLRKAVRHSGPSRPQASPILLLPVSASRQALPRDNPSRD